jgi:hypothetical protein
MLRFLHKGGHNLQHLNTTLNGTPLMLAAVSGKLSIVEYLTEEGKKTHFSKS